MTLNNINFKEWWNSIVVDYKTKLGINYSSKSKLKTIPTEKLRNEASKRPIQYKYSLLALNSFSYKKCLGSESVRIEEGNKLELELIDVSKKNLYFVTSKELDSDIFRVPIDTYETNCIIRYLV
jgi:hypothetical protein